MSFGKDNLKKVWRNSRLQEAVDFSVEIIKIVIISLAIIIPVRYFLVQPFYVKGASMEPTFFNHEYLIINEIDYRFEAPARGEVVVFRPPYGDHTDYFIKRIIGLPGEEIKVKNGRILVFNKEHPEGIVLDESFYLASDLITSGDYDKVLAADEYFLLGDNRGSSLDSRMFGPVKKESIVGKVWVRGWPFNRLTVFSPPPYNL